MAEEAKPQAPNPTQPVKKARMKSQKSKAKGRPQNSAIANVLKTLFGDSLSQEALDDMEEMTTVLEDITAIK